MADQHLILSLVGANVIELAVHCLDSLSLILADSPNKVIMITFKIFFNPSLTVLLFSLYSTLTTAITLLNIQGNKNFPRSNKVKINDPEISQCTWIP